VQTGESLEVLVEYNNYLPGGNTLISYFVTTPEKLKG